MRTFNFKARIIGEEKYLTYTMGEDCELDEDILDYCQENAPNELIEILYEEDDDYDYLTYPVTGKISMEEYILEEQNCESVLKMVRNVAQEMISLREQAIPLSYVLLNRGFIYVDVEDKTVQFLCLPIESKGALAVEFKSFIRQLLANMRYDVEENLDYVGKLLTYINSDNFNLRGLVGLSEALMEEDGIAFEEAQAIDAGGVEVVNASQESSVEKNIGNIMGDFGTDEETPLPEIGDDEEEESEEETSGSKEPDDREADALESILPTGMQGESEKETPSEEAEEQASEEAEEQASATTETSEEVKTEVAASDKMENTDAQSEQAENAEVQTEKTEQPEAQSVEAEQPEAQSKESKTDDKPVAEMPKAATAPKQKESDINVIKNRIRELVGEVPTARASAGSSKSIKTLEDLDQYLGGKAPVVKKNVVKVNRAAIIQQTEAEMEAEAAEVADGAENANGSEEDTTGQTENIKVPVIEDIYGSGALTTDDQKESNEGDSEEEKDSKNKKDNKKDNKKEEKKPKSNSILNITVGGIVEAIGGGNTAPKALPYLVRESTKERIMLNKPTFKIGKATRGVDYTVGGNGAISRQHAIILQRDGVCYIKDNKSTNHTFVNGKRLEEGTEEILTHDSKVRLADEEFTFKIR